MGPATASMNEAAFADLAGWESDDHAAAFSAFLKSAARLEALAAGGAAIQPAPALSEIFRAALATELSGRAAAKAFFEAHFKPHRVVHDEQHGLLTGYYEPLLAGSRTHNSKFKVPLYRRPPDLVNLVDELQRGAVGAGLTHARLVEGMAVPYATRTEIEEGALAGQGLELVYVADPVDAFFVQVQGSACISLPGREKIRITYDGKNGHPYTSVGRYLVDAGILTAGEMSLQSLKVWLRADPIRGRDAMRRNASFVFFRELIGEEAAGPHGVHGIPLTTGRSLAVDTALHAIGTPVWVSSPTLRHAGADADGFRRLMIAQDVGSAIRGPERGDIYFGSGDAAGELAGITKHPGNYCVLLPRADLGSGAPRS